MSRFSVINQAAATLAAERETQHLAAEAERQRKNADLAEAARLKVGCKRRVIEEPPYRIHPTELTTALRQWRRQRGLTQLGAAEVLGLNHRQYETHEGRGLKSLSPEYKARLIAEGVQLPPTQ